MSEKRKEIKMIVAGYNTNGDADFFFCKVSCTESYIFCGEHYKEARDLAVVEGFDPVMVFDETDPGGKAIEPVFVWESATVVTVE